MRNSRTLIMIHDVKGDKIGRATAEVHPRQRVEVPPSGLTQLTQPGGKCDHGVYIPSDNFGDRARDCSICHPYEIIVKENATYKA